MKNKKYYLSEFDFKDEYMKRILGTPGELLKAIESKKICTREDYTYYLDDEALSPNIFRCAKKEECILKLQQLNNNNN